LWSWLIVSKERFKNVREKHKDKHREMAKRVSLVGCNYPSTQCELKLEVATNEASKQEKWIHYMLVCCLLLLFVSLFSHWLSSSICYKHFFSHFFPFSFLCCMVPIPLLFSCCIFQEFGFILFFNLHDLLLLVYGRGILLFLWLLNFSIFFPF
jgi:hypothetical protein